MTPVVLVFAAKVAVSLLLTLLVLLFVRFRSAVLAYVQAREDSVLGLTFTVFRLIPFILIYLVLDELPRNDVPFFYEKATKALEGQMVYRDFWSFHAPLFSYLIAVPLWLWHSPKAIVLLMLLVEGTTVWLTYRYYRTHNPEAILLAILYLILPAPLVICLLGGQEDIALWLFGLLTMGVARRRGQSGKGAGLSIGLIMAVALLTLKLTFVMIAFPVFFLLKDKIRWIAGLALPGIPALVILYALMGWLFLMPVQHGELPFSPNLSTVLRPLIGVFFNEIPLKTMNWVAALATIGLLSATGYRFRNLPYAAAFPSVWIVAFGLFMLLQPSAMAYYVFIYLIAVIFELTPLNDGRRIGLLLAVNLLVVIQPFVFVYLDQPFFNSFGQIDTGLRLVEYLLEVATVGCVGAYVWLAYRRLRQLEKEPTDVVVTESRILGFSR
ncbi:hypothetical protein [Larkinella soli]|uniref:hypothetical protein n=1 Tax=Larkinella soli TaxID=1770527 RepID=UPI000FFBF551|nr:hypothetical protein [Larkinella soli]